MPGNGPEPVYSRSCVSLYPACADAGEANSHNAEDHFKRLQEILERLRTAELKLKPSKCYLFQKSVHYLGHIISEHGIKTDPQKIQCIKEWPIPTCTEEIRQFLVLATYYHKFVKNFAQIAAPLYRAYQRKRRHGYGRKNVRWPLIL